MAITGIRARSELAAADVLAPERYDPRRALALSTGERTRVSDIAEVSRRTVSPSHDLGQCYVLDTSDAREGIVVARGEPIVGAKMGSTKKVVEARNVIISRLRPYLRQVAFVDAGFSPLKTALVICSTEFYVLRPRDQRSIAFLVPFLLSEKIQGVLAASQEGGHHPRFDEGTLLGLPIPQSLLEARDRISQLVEEAASLYRQHEARLRGATEIAGLAVT